jgi:uncharacterized protein with PIN domain
VSRPAPFRAVFRFYEELNDFLPPGKRRKRIVYAFSGKPAVKDAIEAQGVPHTEVDLIVVGGESVGFDHHLRDGDEVAVYPVFESLDITPVVKLREEPLREPRFVLDVHLGKLARLLRLLGFDALYRSDYDDPEIVRLSVEQRRVVLTRDRQLLHARVITHGYCLRSTDPEEQLAEVIRRFDLRQRVAPFSRCLSCNEVLEPVAKEEVLDRLEPRTRRDHDTFVRCPACERIFWPGSHHRRLSAVVERFRGD